MKFKFLVLLAFIVLFLGCEKEQEAIDDDGEEQIENNISIENDDINTYEVVTFNIVGTNLNDSYTAKLGNTDVILNKIDDTTLGLLIPAIDNGTYTLDFELGNIDINVTQTTLEKAKEVVLDEYKAMVEENFSPTTTIPKSQGAAILENIFANATEDEKQAIALFFEANNEVFNE
ncbi:hypothetical protein MWU65_17530, partial [Cellulophaga sp. F20128]|uniref:hypothetical protein n=1 Tax=Cellulophaga sp. F20128 TaxID=2926413 RepID=UPI001FF4C06B